MAQFSLKSLLGVMVVASIGLAGLTHPTRYFNFIVVSFALAVVGLISLHAAFSRSTSKAFSIGFAASSWAYLLLIWNDMEYSLATTWALEAMYPLLNRGVDVNMTHYGVFFVGDNGFPLLTKYSNYLHIGHALWMLAIGYVGGLSACWFGREAKGPAGLAR